MSGVRPAASGIRPGRPVCDYVVHLLSQHHGRHFDRQLPVAALPGYLEARPPNLGALRSGRLSTLIAVSSLFNGLGRIVWGVRSGMALKSRVFADVDQANDVLAAIEVFDPIFLKRPVG